MVPALQGLCEQGNNFAIKMLDGLLRVRTSKVRTFVIDSMIFLPVS